MPPALFAVCLAPMPLAWRVPFVWRVVGGVVACLGSFWGAAVQAAPLPQLAIDPDRVSVSGLSSGGFMAVQLHVAHSATFRAGAGVVAGGPYLCAEGSLFNATGRCMAHSAPIPVAALVSTTRAWAAQGRVDPVAGLATSRVYLFSGTQDETVRPAVVASLKDYYRAFMPASQIAERRDVPAGHAMVTDDFGSRCNVSATPFINDCDVDVAGALLQHLHGPLNPRQEGALTAAPQAFDQRTFVQGHGMAETGWAYVPRACAEGARCGVHVALHGCRQNTATIDARYVQRTGYNRWADSNRLVVLYPQTGADATNGCWDWWGYDSPNYAHQAGPQIAAIKAMVDRVSGRPPAPPGPCVTASNTAHVQQGRAYWWWGLIRARGSDQTLGWWGFGSSTLREAPPGTFTPVASGQCGP